MPDSLDPLSTEPDEPPTHTQPPKPDGAAAPSAVTASGPMLTPLFKSLQDNADDAAAIPGYVVQSELARGGMGVVYRAVDPAFDREVAIKVLLPELHGDPEAAARFAAEVRISGRLQHPGIPPVHALGALADGRPFFAMKLIRGRTLAAIIKEQFARAPDAPACDAPDLIQVFERVCQAVGYAHSEGIVHRDLKPHNIMVGAFGEVQVMDWGLAKELPEPAAAAAQAEDAPATPRPHHSADSTVTMTQPGAILGTPAYMAPEQARGQVELVDARSDVFALGGILCAILTGRPPYSVRSSSDAVRLAADGDLLEGFARLDASGADPELIALAKSCLSRHAPNRPPGGGAVAELVAQHRARVERRLRAVEAERAAAKAREAERRKKRRVQAALAAAVVAILIGGLLAAWREDRLGAERRSERDKAEVARAFQERQVREGVAALLALGADLRRQCRFREARDTLRQAEQMLASEAADDLKPLVALAIDDLHLAQQLDRIRYQKAVWVPAKIIAGRVLDPGQAVRAYADALQRRGFNPLTEDEAALAARIEKAAIRSELLEALDDWAAFEADAAVRARVLAVLRRVEPGPWLDRFRTPEVRGDRAAVEALAAEAEIAALRPTVLVSLGILMQSHGLDPSKMLARAQVVRPGDFDLAVALGLWWSGRNEYAKSLGHFRVARALRPENGAALAMTGVLLAVTFDLDTALPTLEEAVRVDPDFAVAWAVLGCARVLNGDRAGGVAALREAIRLEPQFPHAFAALGLVSAELGDHRAAAEAFREVIRLDPNFPDAYEKFGQALWNLGELDAAAEAYREAVKRNPKDADALDDLVGVLNDLGNARRKAGKPDAAAAAYAEAIAAHPTDARAHYNLGTVWQYDRNDPRRASACYETALRLNPDLAIAHANLALCRLDLNDGPGAVAAAEQAVKLAPKVAWFRNVLGWAKYRTDDYDGAISEFEAAIRLDPKYAMPHNNLGLIWMSRREFDRAASAFEAAAQLDPNFEFPHRNLADLWLRREQPEKAAAAARAAIRINPHSPLAHALLARALGALGEFRAAADGLNAALRSHPNWVQDPGNTCRMYLAIFSVRAGLGHGIDPVPPDERAEYRRNALKWLKDECALRRRVLDLIAFRLQMAALLREPNLAYVRHPLLLAALPADEIASWNAFWNEVRALRDGEGDGASPTLAPAPRPR